MTPRSELPQSIVLFACVALFAADSIVAAKAEPATQNPPALDLPAMETAALDRDIEAILRKSDVPGASIAVVRDGKIIYSQAYGVSSLEDHAKATQATRYDIGSVSKQFTATAILLLAEDGKLALDDPIDKYVPGLTAGAQISIRRLLNHTAGYADYCPQDYVTAEERVAVTPVRLVKEWATVPLDFQPGEDWRYCNTCYVIAGLIVEKASGETFERFLEERIFHPLKMQSALDVDRHPGAQDARGYTRYAFGPVRPSPVAASGWLYATGGLAMTASDLARWDIAMINRTLLKQASYEQQFMPVKLSNGRDARYGLGVEVTTAAGRRVYQHGGNISGFQAYNRIYPDDRAAIVVLTNTDFGGAARDAIVARIAAGMFDQNSDIAEDRAAYDLLREGRIERSNMTANALAYFTSDVLNDYRASLQPLGEPIRFSRLGEWHRGGFTGVLYDVIYRDRVLQLDIFKTANGKYEEIMVFAPD